MNSLTEANRDNLIGQVLGIDNLMVSRAQANTANLAAADSIAPIIDDDCLIFVMSPGVDMMGVSSMKTFTWEPGGGQGRVKSYYADDRNSTIVQHQEQWDMKLIASATGYLFEDIV
jgi:hypothetical protein